MKLEDLYEKLQRTLEEEEPGTLKYRRALDSIPILSPESLLKYHKYVVKKIEKAKAELRELKEKMEELRYDKFLKDRKKEVFL